MRDGGDLEYFLRIYDVVFTVDKVGVSKSHAKQRYIPGYAKLTKRLRRYFRDSTICLCDRVPGCSPLRPRHRNIRGLLYIFSRPINRTIQCAIGRMCSNAIYGRRLISTGQPFRSKSR